MGGGLQGWIRGAGGCPPNLEINLKASVALKMFFACTPNPGSTPVVQARN